ncbi:MAG: glycine--tRNA ligase subunit beta [Nitrospiraceae bacterium]|nr:MAG: glycine--tRNA ligase subunit beta [Nitrospiraceae bacterium]
MKTLLIEIGTEEIPARFVKKGMDILKDEFSKSLTDSVIEYDGIQGYATPRRLALIIEKVAEKQKDRIVESIGPPKKIAYDDSGKPTKAATGFARSLHIDVADLKISRTERGEYLSATVEEKGRSTVEVLSESLPRLITSLQLPKSMRWGNGALRFFRPIHWIVALYGERIIPFELDGIKSGNFTYGHRFLSPAAIPLKRPEDYVPALFSSHVIADMDVRKKTIADQLSLIESENGCHVSKDEELLNIVTNLVEYPAAVVGSFEDTYLALPKELPITVMRTHQKYFSTHNRKGDLLPHFVVISNTRPENNETVRKGAEKVLRARLEDARFYFSEDLAKPFETYVDDLKSVTFQEKLGSLLDKTERIVALSAFLTDRLSIGQKEHILRAARLAKADLVTGIVSEFPELQGYMGMIYAARSGEHEDVASAIFEHYRPRFSGDDLPTGEIGTIISLADKIDNVASFFHLGLIPTGSEDPFALRRQAVGVINILHERGYLISIDTLIDTALKSIDDSPDTRQESRNHAVQFFSQRLEFILSARGFRHDLIKAVLSSNELEIKSIWSRIDVLAALKQDAAFPGLLTAAKRVYSILSKTTDLNLAETVLTESAERELLDMANDVDKRITGTAYSALYELEAPISAFFDKVFVMDKDPAVRNNRLALLQRVRALFDSLCDFSRILDE